MEQAYDLKVLGEKLKARGLDVAEEQLEGVIVDVFGWAKESAAVSATPLDNIAVAVIEPFLVEVKKAIDFNKDGQ